MAYRSCLQGYIRGLFCLVIRLITGVRAQWLGCHPSEHTRIYFANHASHLDALVIWASLPPSIRYQTRPVAAQDYWESSAIRRFMANYLLNAILVNRRSSSPLQIIDTLTQAIHNGSSLIFFPEGTRVQNGDIGPFKSGLYYLAQTEAELIPVYLENLSRILPKGEYLPVPIIGSARFGTPINLMHDEKKHAFLERARSAILILKET